MPTHANKAPYARAPLTRKQKGIFARMAKDAYDQRAELGLIDPAETPLDGWRAEQAEEACGRRISAATQSDYRALLAHFKLLLGKPDEAFGALLKTDHPAGEIERLEQAMDRLQKECAAANVPFPAYPNGILKKGKQPPLHRLGADAVWKLAHTVRNRRHLAETR